MPNLRGLEARSRHVQTKIQLALPRGEPLVRRDLQRLQLFVIVRRAQVLDIPGPTPRRVHDLDRRRPRSDLHRAHVHHDPRLRADLVRKSGSPSTQTRRSQRYARANLASVIRVRSDTHHWTSRLPELIAGAVAHPLAYRRRGSAIQTAADRFSPGGLFFAGRCVGGSVVPTLVVAMRGPAERQALPPAGWRREHFRSGAIRPPGVSRPCPLGRARCRRSCPPGRRRAADGRPRAGWCGRRCRSAPLRPRRAAGTTSRHRRSPA